MANSVTIAGLLTKYPIISDQVNKAQIQVILTELENVLGKGTEGEIVEFGCYIGTTSLFIRRLLDERHETKTFHVYDSFEGLPEKSFEDNSGAGEQFKAGELSVSKKLFLHEFQKASLKPPVTHKGWFSELTESDVPARIAFAFLDGDFYQSIKDSLRLVLPRMEQGSCIIIDDYAREALPGARKAVHELLPNARVQTAHNLGIIHL
jgi:O-methyltransferase